MTGKADTATAEVNLPEVEVAGTAAAVAEPQTATSEVTPAEAATAITASPLAEAALAEAATEEVEAATEAVEDATEAAQEPVEALADAVTHTMTESGAAISGDDLTRVSGIGPKTVAVLAAAGITTYAQLAAATEAGLREILENAGPRYRLLDPTTWPDQAGRLLDESAQ
jgi:predicted flap endonuclease-1-like 5' DNA nuclease